MVHCSHCSQSCYNVNLRGIHACYTKIMFHKLCTSQIKQLMVTLKCRNTREPFLRYGIITTSSVPRSTITSMNIASPPQLKKIPATTPVCGTSSSAPCGKCYFFPISAQYSSCNLINSKYNIYPFSKADSSNLKKAYTVPFLTTK